MLDVKSQLLYLSDKKLNPIPDWASFYLLLGNYIGSLSLENTRIIASLAIPTRVFACSLVATGIVLARSENSNDTAHVQYIRNLKPGTHVYLRTDKNSKLRGVVEKFKEINGKEWIFIRTGQKEMLPRLLNHFASRITVSDQDVSLPKYSRGGYSLQAPSKFLQCCLGKELAKNHILESSFETLIIGKKSAIEHEINIKLFCCTNSNKPDDSLGCLQEILRMRQFSGANKSYRTQCISSLSTAPEKELEKQVPPIVIFDGAVAYLKLSHIWQNAHQIVLLDRTERQFFDAVELLNQNYAYRLADVSNLSVKIPNGVEMMIYKESI